MIGVEDVGGYVPRAFVTIHPNPNGNVKDIEEEIKEFANGNELMKMKIDYDFTKFIYSSINHFYSKLGTLQTFTRWRIRGR